jgi:hypothetical protein
MFRSSAGRLRFLASLCLTRAATVTLETSSSGVMSRASSSMTLSNSTSSLITCVDELSFPFKTLDPFLFCVYHKDNYPAGLISFPSLFPHGVLTRPQATKICLLHGKGMELTLIRINLIGCTMAIASLASLNTLTGDSKLSQRQWVTSPSPCVSPSFPL